MTRPGPVGWLRELLRDEIEEIHRAALRVLDEIGLVVANATARYRLARPGARVAGERVYFAPSFVEDQLASIRRAGGPVRRKKTSDRLALVAGDMPIYYHRPGTDEIRLMTTPDLIDVVKSVEVMRARGISGSVPGIPCDVPAPLQPLVTYRAGAEFSAAGGATHTLHPPETLRYLFRMAEAMGAPIETAGVFPISPLRLGGHELDAIVEFQDRWRGLWAYSLPAVGSTGPIRERAAWVLSVAEALGAAVALHIISDGKPVTIQPGMYAFDLRALSLAGGAPEYAWMRWVGSQIGRFYNPLVEYRGFVTTQAKRPGAQAGAEKAIGGAFGILTGCDGLEYAGALGFDDIFSPEQMVLDREMVDALEHLSRGVPRGDIDAWVDLVRQGATSGYMQTNATLDSYGDTYWLPRVFDRLTWPSFKSREGQYARERATAELRAMLAEYEYRPPAAIEDVRRIFREAWRALGGDPQAECLSLLTNE